MGYARSNYFAKKREKTAHYFICVVDFAGYSEDQGHFGWDHHHFMPCLAKFSVFRLEILMKRLILCSTMLAAIANHASTVQSQIYFEDNFDSYTDQTAFESVWAPVGCTLSGIPAACTVSPGQGNTLSQDFPERGNVLLNVSPPAAAPGTLNESDRNQIILTPAQTPPLLTVGAKLAFSFDFFDIEAYNGTLGSPYRQNVTLQYRNPADGTFPLISGQLLAMGFNNSQNGSQSGGQFYMGRVLGYDPRNAPGATPPADPDGGPEEAVGGGGAFFKLNDFSTGTSAGPGSRQTGEENAWRNLKVEVTTNDGSTQDYAFYVDGVLAERVSSIPGLRQYNVIRLGSGVSSTQDAYYDNFLLEYFPAVAPSNTADFNGDGEIDAADYVIWRKHNGAIGSGTQSTGDANGDTNVDSLDYAEWSKNFGSSPAGSGGGAVPEPSTVMLLLLGISAFSPRRRSNK